MHAVTVGEEKAALEDLLSAQMREPVRVRIVEGADASAPASVAQERERAAREGREARLRQGREHPAVQRAASVLGAEIEDVRDLGGGETA